MHKRLGIGKPTASESDHYEELLVNLAILALTGKWGNIDCGGLEYVVVRYGNFYQFIVPAGGGQVSIAFGLEANPVAWADTVIELLRNHSVTQKGIQ